MNISEKYFEETGQVAEAYPDRYFVWLEQSLEEANKQLESMKEILIRVDNEFDYLSSLDSPESVHPNDRLWDEINELLEDVEKEGKE